MENLCSFVLASSYSEGQRKQAPTHACSLMQAGQKVSSAKAAQGWDEEGAVWMEGSNT